MTNKIYVYTIDHEAKHIWLPSPIVAGDIGSPPSWACYARNYRFKTHFEGYTNGILTKESWLTHITKNKVLSINSSNMENQ